MTDFERHAGPAIMRHEARECRRCDSAVDVLAALVLGIFGALGLMHSAGWLL